MAIFRQLPDARAVGPVIASQIGRSYRPTGA